MACCKPVHTANLASSATPEMPVSTCCGGSCACVPGKAQCPCNGSSNTHNLGGQCPVSVSSVVGQGAGKCPLRGSSSESGKCPLRGSSNESGKCPFRGSSNESGKCPFRGSSNESGKCPLRGSSSESGKCPLRGSSNESGKCPFRNAGPSKAMSDKCPFRRSDIMNSTGNKCPFRANSGQFCSYLQRMITEHGYDFNQCHLNKSTFTTSYHPAYKACQCQSINYPRSIMCQCSSIDINTTNSPCHATARLNCACHANCQCGQINSCLKNACSSPTFHSPSRCCSGQSVPFTCNSSHCHC